MTLVVFDSYDKIAAWCTHQEVQFCGRERRSDVFANKNEPTNIANVYIVCFYASMALLKIEVLCNQPIHGDLAYDRNRPHHYYDAPGSAAHLNFHRHRRCSTYKTRLTAQHRRQSLGHSACVAARGNYRQTAPDRAVNVQG